MFDGTAWLSGSLGFHTNTLTGLLDLALEVLFAKVELDCLHTFVEMPLPKMIRGIS